MNIFCFIGSNNIKSNSYVIVNRIMKKLLILEPNANIECCLARDIHIEMCCGCRECFDKGYCSLKSSDDMLLIEKKLKLADIIVLASPVYANNVSGTMKNFIDRLSYWFHTLELAGKHSVVFSITDSTGWGYVEDYLEKILFYWGTKGIGKYHFVLNQKEGSDFERTEQKIAKEILEKDKSEGYSSVNLEKYYVLLQQNYKKADMAIDSKKNYEIMYWSDSDISRCKSFEEWAIKKRRK